jgi:hypothetical protein
MLVSALCAVVHEHPPERDASLAAPRRMRLAERIGVTLAKPCVHDGPGPLDPHTGISCRPRPCGLVRQFVGCLLPLDVRDV